MKNIQEVAFAFFSANLHRYIPAVDWTQHETLYQQFLHYHKACDKQHIPWSVQHLDRIDRIGILVLFHLGNHEVLPIRLAEAGLRFDILLSRAVYERHVKTLTAHQQRFKALGMKVSYLFAEHPRVVFQIRNSIRQKHHILIFADGNIGTAIGKYNLLEVPFMQASLWIKPGTGFLSHLFDIPVYPIRDSFLQDYLHIEVGQPIVPQPQEDRAVYLNRCMQGLYANLESRLRGAPLAWACWRELHLNGMLGPQKQTGDRPHTGDGIIRIQMGGDIYRFDRANYHIQRLKR